MWCFLLLWIVVWTPQLFCFSFAEHWYCLTSTTRHHRWGDLRLPWPGSIPDMYASQWVWIHFWSLPSVDARGWNFAFKITSCCSTNRSSIRNAFSLSDSGRATAFPNSPRRCKPRRSQMYPARGLEKSSRSTRARVVTYVFDQTWLSFLSTMSGLLFIF